MKAEKGLSLIELLVGLAIISFVIGGIYALYSFGEESWRRASQMAQAREEGSLALNFLARDIREISPPDEETTILYADYNEVKFLANVDSDPEPESLHYFFQPPNSLARGVAETTSSEPPYHFSEAEKVTTLTTHCQNSLSNPIFTYLVSTTETLDNLPLSSDDLKKIKMIKVSILVDVDPSRPPEAWQSQVIVTPRNLP